MHISSQRDWQVLTHRDHFQSGYFGMYPIILAHLLHQLMRFTTLQGVTKQYIRENC